MTRSMTTPTTAMVSVDGWSSQANDRDREGKASRQFLTAEVDEIDSKVMCGI